MVDGSHATWMNADITGMPLMDIKAAFLRVAKQRLVNEMKTK